MEWISMAEKPLRQDDALEVIGFHPAWVDEDYNPNGTRVGFINAEGGFTCAHWCGYHDEYHTQDELSKEYFMPTHYMFIPDTSNLKH